MSQYADHLAALSRDIDSAAQSELMAIIGSLEALKAQAWIRAVSTTTAAAQCDREGDDSLLTVREAAALLHVSERYVRDHENELGGRVRLPGGRALRFSRRRLDSYIRRQSYRA